MRIAAAALMALAAVAMVYLLVARRRHLRARLEQRLRDSREQERRKIARALHDDVGQMLTALRLDLQRLDAVDAPMRRRIIADDVGLVDRLLAHVRDLSVTLRPTALDDLGLAAAVRWLLHRHSERAGYTAHLDDRLGELVVPDPAATAAFDLVRESLANVARHARARNVRIELSRTNGRLHVGIHDDGSGFDVAAAQRRAESGSSLGVLDMHDTVRRAGGTLSITSHPDDGTSVAASIPLEHRP